MSERARVHCTILRQDWTCVAITSENLLVFFCKSENVHAVKREDEQAFALRNGQNLMFCEDAARRLKQRFDTFTELSDFRISVTHKESLHPHNAVAIITKGA